jgi:hypothetical protein
MEIALGDRMVTQNVKVKGPPERSMKSIRSLMEKRGWTIREFKTEEGVIAARTPASILSWGEDITVRIKPSDSGSVVAIESSPAAQVFDWGRSETNVKNLASEIGAL